MWSTNVLLKSFYRLKANFRINPLKYWQRINGILKELIVKIGIACTTNFIKPLTCDRSFSPHPWNFLQTLSFVFVNLSLLFLPTWDGRTKYLSNCFISGTPNKFLINICLFVRGWTIKTKYSSLDLFVVSRPFHMKIECFEFFNNHLG